MKIRIVIALSILALSMPLSGQDKDLIDILQEELAREMEFFKDGKDSVYFLSYSVSDDKNTTISASGGSISMLNSTSGRSGRVDIRLGSYDRDQTRSTGVNQYYPTPYVEPMSLPKENNEEAIRYALWKSTKDAFLSAKARFVRLASEEQTSKTKDFSRVKPQKSKPMVQHEADLDFDKWSETLKEISLLFVSNEHILTSSISLNYSDQIKYFVSSEGTAVREKQTNANIYITASVGTEDGEIPFLKSFFAFTPDQFPTKAELIKEAKEVIKTLEELRQAPKAEPYSGPAILSPKAAGVFFHEIFGHRIEGHRLKQETDGQTFKDKIGERVLSGDISVYSDPTIQTYGDLKLSGTYAYDDQGVKAERVEIVKDGILKTFLMSRSPLESIEKSNGHARASGSLNPVARQSNLIIEGSKGLNDDELRKLLIEECKRTGKPYGYYFDEVLGGFTQTDRYSTNAFNIEPLLVYKIYADGRPDELVRGVNLIGTPLVMFSQIKATGNTMATFNGFCGAESGYIPVSATAPSLFVEKIETQKKPVTMLRKPSILKNPILESIKGNER